MSEYWYGTSFPSNFGELESFLRNRSSVLLLFLTWKQNINIVFRKLLELVGHKTCLRLMGDQKKKKMYYFYWSNWCKFCLQHRLMLYSHSHYMLNESNLVHLWGQSEFSWQVARSVESFLTLISSAWDATVTCNEIGNKIEQTIWNMSEQIELCKFSEASSKV